MARRAPRIGDILIEDGKLTQEELEKAIHVQRSTNRVLGDILVDLGYIKQIDIVQALATQLDIPFYDLGDDFALEPEEVALIPETVARRFCLIPVRKDPESTSLVVVMRDPLDIEAVDAVRSMTSLDVQKAVGAEDRILEIISKYYREDAYLERNLQDIVDLEEEETGLPGGGSPESSDQLRLIANDAPVVRFVNLLLMQAVRDGASDIHFEPGEHNVSVRLRIDGRLRDVTPPPKSLYHAIVTRIKILSDMDIAERRLPRDGRFKFRMTGRVIDMRVSSLPEVHGEKVVMRILDRDSLIVDLDAIGFHPAAAEAFQRVLHMPNGIILLTGPTGSGKTTTLYSALNILKSRERNIQTVEDPVEYQVDGINQMQVRPNVGLDFSMALRAILRQDPDVILIGEIRDLETSRIAMRAAMTGHMVLSSLHTNDAAAAFSRLRDIGVEPFLIGSSVRAVISQRLIRRICPACKEVVPDPHEMVHKIEPFCSDAASWTYYRGAGCDKCGETGYKGRTAIIEFLEVTDSISEMVQDGRGDREIKARALEQGMSTLLMSGFKRIKDGVTTLDEVLSVCTLLEQ
jgi:type IV pilus assembly protein PilB